MADAVGEVIATKTVNAFFSSAEASPKLAFGGQASVEKMQGGDWVGGTLTVTVNAIEFQANSMNRALTDGDLDRVIGWDDVLNVRQRFGFFTGIVDIVRKDGSIFSVRCYGAKQLALAILGGMAVRQIKMEQAAK